MATYIYTYSQHFPNGVNSKKLGEEIDNSSITKNFDVRMIGEKVKIIFEEVLTTGEKSTLDSIVEFHTPNNYIARDKYFTVYPLREYIKTPTYTKVSLFNYAGSKKIGKIHSIELIAEMEIGVESYDARIFDRTHGKVIAELKNLTNLFEEILEFETISNVPEQQSLLEIQLKKNGSINSKQVHFDAVNIYYGS